MIGMVLLDSIEKMIQLTDHLMHPSELTFAEWVFLIALAVPFVILAYVLIKAGNKAMEGNVPRGPGGNPRWW